MFIKAATHLSLQYQRLCPQLPLFEPIVAEDMPSQQDENRTNAGTTRQAIVVGKGKYLKMGMS